MDKNKCPACQKWTLDFDTLECEFCGSKFIFCSACGGSGIYDSEGSPPCGSCGGTGLEKK